MLVIDLRRLVEAPLEVKGEVNPEDPLWHESDVDLITPLAFEGRAESAGAGAVRVAGVMESRARGRCRRCLRPLELDVSEKVDLIFDPRAGVTEEDLSLYRLEPEAEELDLRAMLRERLILAVARYPLCRVDCRGLCKRCGADLNEETCSCKEGELDPRWGPLLASRDKG